MNKARKKKRTGPAPSNLRLVDAITVKLKSIGTPAPSTKLTPKTPFAQRLLQYLHPPGQETATKIVENLTRDPIIMFYPNAEGEVTSCLTRNPTIKFIRNTSHMLLDIVDTDRIFTFARDDEGGIVGCLAVDEVVRYELDEEFNHVGCLTTDRIFAFERVGEGLIVRFERGYVRSGEGDVMGSVVVNKEWVFVRDEARFVEGCVEKEGSMGFEGGCKLFVE